jgi:hypothetical protein
MRAPIDHYLLTLTLPKEASVDRVPLNHLHPAAAKVARRQRV